MRIFRSELLKLSGEESVKYMVGAGLAIFFGFMSQIVTPVRLFLDAEMRMSRLTALMGVLLFLLVGGVCVFLVLIRRLTQLRKDATTDFHLGIYNARECDSRIKQALSLLDRKKVAFCLVLMDIDGFKRINEQEKYASGNLILRQFLEIAKTSIRDTDVLCRYLQGDEFVILMPLASAEIGRIVADRIRTRVERFDFQGKTLNRTVKITVSAGVAGIDATQSQATLEGVKNLLEDALRVAKLTKNKVVNAQPK